MKDNTSPKEFLKLELAELGYSLTKIISYKKPEYRGIISNGKEFFDVKAVDKHQYFSSEISKSFYNNEAKIGNRIKSSYQRLAGQNGFYYTKHFAIFIYSYYQLGSIGRFFADQDFNLLQTIVLLRDLFVGLEELKTIGFYHKFFHESNVYVTNQTIKIGGFEYCEEVSAAKLPFEHQKDILATMNTSMQSIPPEVIFNRSTGIKSSMYCLGALLFKLLYKRPHFAAKKLLDVENQYKNRVKIDFPNDLPPDFSMILRRLLEYDPESRMSPYELKQELSYLLSYCKNFEEEIRQSVYYKKNMVGFKNIALRELKMVELDSHPDIEQKPPKPHPSEKSKPEIEMKLQLKVRKRQIQSSSSTKDSSRNLPLIGPSICFTKKLHYSSQNRSATIKQASNSFINFKPSAHHEPQRLLNYSFKNQGSAHNQSLP
jgi:hypothetical protein